MTRVVKNKNKEDELPSLRLSVKEQMCHKAVVIKTVGLFTDNKGLLLALFPFTVLSSPPGCGHHYPVWMGKVRPRAISQGVAAPGLEKSWCDWKPLALPDTPPYSLPRAACPSLPQEAGAHSWPFWAKWRLQDRRRVPAALMKKRGKMSSIF